MFGYVGRLIDLPTAKQAQAFNEAQRDNGFSLNHEGTLLIWDLNEVRVNQADPEQFLLVGLRNAGSMDFRSKARTLGMVVDEVQTFTEVYYTGSDSGIHSHTVEEFNNGECRP